MDSRIKVLIVEDEMIIAAKISLHLQQLGYDVVGVLPRGEEAVLHCRRDPPDLLLLDVKLKGLLDGIDTARLLEKEGIIIPIIYLTANVDQPTFDRAKTTHPLAYLPKPYRKQELARAVELALLQRNTQPDIPRSSQVLTDRIFVRYKERMVRLFLEDILYVEAERAYCKVVTRKNEYVLSMALGRLREQLVGVNLMRVHRSYVINLLQMDEITDAHVVIAGKAIPVSKKYRDDFTERLQLIR